jgi:glycosyltransferase involved in cell wall biosynthesis
MSRTPRILRIITRMNVGGPATHVILADRGLRNLGWETLLLHGTVEPHEIEVDLPPVTLVPRIRIPAMARAVRARPDARALATIARIIRRYRPDIIHTHMSKAGVLGRLAGLATASGAARVHTFHGTVFGGYFGERTSRSIVHAERILGHRTTRIAVVPLGLDLERFADQDRLAARNRLHVAADELVLLAVGRLVPIKRLDRLIKTFSRVAHEIPAARLYLVGDGPERDQLLRAATSAGVGDRVIHVGWSSDTPSWYAAADVVALTSEREGTPLALIEAAAAGRPVIATDVGGVADIVADRVTGFVVPPDDEEALTDRLRTLLGDPALRGRMGGAGPARATLYSAERLVLDLDALYRNILGWGPNVDPASGREAS